MNSMTYLEHISHKALGLINSTHNDFFNDHFLLPLGINTPYTYNDIDKQIRRLKKLYQDGRENEEKTYSSNLILADLLNHYFFEYDKLIQGCSPTDTYLDYYQDTKKAFKKIQCASQKEDSNYRMQNLLYEIVIRNLLIIGENISRYGDSVDLRTIEISLDAVEYLCREQLEDLFKFKDYNYYLNGADQKAEFVKEHGGFPFRFRQYVDDPEKKSHIKYWFRGIPQIPQDVEIHLYDCNFAHLFYAVFLTALVVKLEATY